MMMQPDAVEQFDVVREAIINDDWPAFCNLINDPTFDVNVLGEVRESEAIIN